MINFDVVCLLLNLFNNKKIKKVSVRLLKTLEEKLKKKRLPNESLFIDNASDSICWAIEYRPRYFEWHIEDNGEEVVVKNRYADEWSFERDMEWKNSFYPKEAVKKLTEAIDETANSIN